MIRHLMFIALLAFVFAVPSFAGFIDFNRPGYKFVVPPPAFPKAKNGVVTLHYMPGGVVGEHLRQSFVWKDMGYRLVIADDQYSAAAMMVLHFHVRGGKVCAKKGADLYFHGLTNAKTGKQIAHRDMFVAIFGHKHTATIGKLSQRKFKRIAPEKFGIPRC